MGIIAQGHIIVFLKNKHMQWSYGHNAKGEGQQNSFCPFQKQLLPVSFAHGKIEPHTRYIE